MLLGSSFINGKIELVNFNLIPFTSLGRFVLYSVTVTINVNRFSIKFELLNTVSLSYITAPPCITVLFVPTSSYAFSSSLLNDSPVSLKSAQDRHLMDFWINPMTYLTVTALDKL